MKVQSIVADSHFSTMVNLILWCVIGLFFKAGSIHGNECSMTQNNVDLLHTDKTSSKYETCSFDGLSIGFIPIIPSWTVYLRLDNNELEDHMFNTSVFNMMQISNISFFQAKNNKLKTLPLLPWQVQSINLMTNQLSSLDFHYLANYTQLKYLLLYDNKIANIIGPQTMFPNFERLSVGKNKIQTIDFSIFGKMPNTLYINAAVNPITYINGSLWNLQNIQYVYLYTMQSLFSLDLTSISTSHDSRLKVDLKWSKINSVFCSGNCSLNKIERFDMNYLKLTILDLNVWITSYVFSLQLPYNPINTIIKLNKPINSMKRIYINLIKNKLTLLDFGDFENIHSLGVNIYASDNQIANILPSVKQLAVATLYLNDNQLTCLNFSVFQNRKEIFYTLAVQRNKIDQLICTSHTVTIQTLDIRSNLLKHIDMSCFDSFIYLKTLQIQDNLIFSIIYDTSTVLNNLLTFDIRGNNLTVLNFELFSIMPIMKTISISSNSISSVIDSTESYKPKIAVETLNADSNHLPYLDMNWFQNYTSLKTINAYYNNIQYVKSSSTILSSLLTIDLNFNQITEVDFSWFNDLPSLTTLSLKDNNIVDLKKSLHPIPNLLTVYLNNNNISFLNTIIFENMPLIQKLELQHNQIAKISPQYCEQRFESIQNGFKMYIDHNPLNCDEHWNWTKICPNTIKFYDKSSPTCALPDKLAGRIFEELSLEDLVTDECESNPCQNGSCFDQPFAYTCNCFTGYTGISCETDINECESNPCQNSGLCMDHVNGYTCSCVAGYTGLHCETDINECQSNPCQNSGLCVDHVNGYTCSCIAGYTGLHCETDFNECQSNPCKNSGLCMDHVNGYICSCTMGYTGLHCETDINECQSNPCQNSGLCMDHVNGYTCNCVAGYTGLHCETDINECNSQPCKNSGNCTDLVNGYMCTCLSGYTGHLCETDIDECTSGPCKNNGTCSDAINGYTCTCVSGYTGPSCEIEEPWKTVENEVKNLFSLIQNPSSALTLDPLALMKELQKMSVSLSQLNNPTLEQQEIIKGVLRLSSFGVSIVLGKFNLSLSDEGNVNKTQVKQVVKMAMGIIKVLAETLLTNVTINSPGQTIDIKPLSLFISKVSSDQISNITVQTMYGSVEFETKSSSPLDCLNAVILFAESNILIWDESATNVSSSTINADITPCRNNKNASSTVKKRSVNEPKQDLDIILLAETIIAHRAPYYDVNVPVLSTIQHYLNLDNNEGPACLSIIPAPNNVLDVYIGFNENIDSSNFHQHTGNIHNAHGRGPTCVSYETLVNNNATALYVNVKNNATGNCTEDMSCPTNMTYKYHIFRPECNTWDTTYEIWTKKNCHVLSSSTSRKVRFKSNLMGSLGAGLFVAPNTINFLTVFDNLGQKLVDNAAVIGTMAVLVVLYIILAIICRKLDKKDKHNWEVLPIDDNDSSDKYSYELHVYTGFKRNSGTDSKVSIVLHGTERDTFKRELKSSTRKNFKTGNVNSFLLTTPLDIGAPYMLRVWNDQSGKGNKLNWFLSKVVIVDTFTKEWYVFTCEKWIPDETEESLLLTLPTASDESISFSKNITSTFYNYHLWLSIVYHKICSPFNRVQRLNCCWTILMLLMVCSAMWYGTDSDVPQQVAFTMGIISVTVHQLFTSFMTTAITMPIVIVVILLYDNSKQTSPILTNHESKRNRKRTCTNGQLPHWCVYVAHLLVLCTVLVSGFFTILYAFEWGKGKSEDWLGTLFICVLENIIFISPFMVVCMALLYTFILKADSSLIDFRRTFGKMNLSTTSEKALEPDWQIYEKRQKTLHAQMMTIFRQVFLHLLLLLLLLSVINGNQDGNVYLQNQDMKNIFLKDITEVTKALDTWEWMSTTLIPSLYLTQHYNNENVTEYDKKFINNGYSMRFGPPSLRQIRVKSETCTIRVLVNMTRCIADYSVSDTDTLNYIPGWKQNKSNLNNYTKNAKNAFLYQHQSQESWLWGKVASYAPGGYIANLGISYAEANLNMLKLKEYNWLDKYSRALIVKFNVWNANTNLFNEVIIAFEFSSCGLIQKTIDINSIQLYRYVGAKGLGNLIAEILAALVMLIKTVASIKQIITERKSFFKSLNNITTLIVLIFFNSALGCYVWRSILTVQTIEFMMNNKGSVVDFQPLTITNEIFLIFLGLSAFFLQLQLLHILRYTRVIATLAAILKKSSKSLTNAALCIGIFSMAFIVLFLRMYGSTTYEYHSFIAASNSLILGTLGKFRFDKLAEGSGSFGTFMFIVYLIIQCSIFLNVMCSVLIDYMAVINEDENAKDSEVIVYMLAWFNKTFFHIQEKPSLHSSEDNNQYNAEGFELKIEEFNNNDKDSTTILKKIQNHQLETETI